MTTARMVSRAASSLESVPAYPPVMLDVTGFLVNVLAERLRDATQALVGAAGVRPRQIGLLLVLRAEGVAQQQQLGERLGMDRTTTMQLVCALEEQGMLTREADPADRRAYLLRLTARGVRLARQTEQQSRTAAEQVLAALSPAESKTLHKLLRKALALPTTNASTT